MNRETQVGILFFAVLALAVVLTVFIGDIQFFKKYFKVQVTFDKVIGLQQGDDVRLSGVKIGRVDSLRFEESGLIVVALKIEDGPFRIYDNSPIWVSESTPLGGRHIEVELPHGKPGRLIARDGSARVHGGPPQGISEAVQEAAQKVGTVADAATHTLTQVRSGEGTIGTLLNDKGMAADIRDAIAAIRQISDKINAGKGPVGRMVNDEEAAGDLKEAIHNIREITRKINEGEGALGKLVSDREIGRKTEQMVDSGHETLDAMRKVFRIKTFLGIDGRAIPDDNVLYSKVYLRIEPDDGKYYHVGAAVIDLDRASAFNTPRRLSKISSKDDEIEIKAEILLGWRFFERQISFGVGLLEGQPGGTLLVEPKTLRQAGKVVEQVWFGLEGRSPYETSDIDERIGRAFMLRGEVGANLRFHPRMPVVKLHAGVDNALDDAVYSAGFGVELEDKDLKYLVGLLGATN